MTDLRFEHKSAVSQAVAASDPLEAIKQRQRHLAAASTEDFDVPGYEDLGIVARYRRVAPDEWRQALQFSDGSTTERCAQFLLDSCTGIYRRGETGELEPLWPADQEIRPAEAPGYGDLNQVWDLGCNTARDAVVAVFGGNGNVLEEHADDVLAWMRRVQRPADEAAVKG